MKKAMIIAVIIVLGTVNIYAIDDDNVLTFSNEFVQIVVGITDIATGRFSMDTTGGNPLWDTDVDATLIYGSPFPWASYTTIRIDGSNYVYGGVTEFRTGRVDHYGEMVQFPKIVDNMITSSWKYGNVLVTQNLSIGTSSTTGEPDTMRIEYIVENKGHTRHDVGLRVMLDTFLGDNDGAPFRLAEQAVDVTKSFEQNELPDYWQAFDSLAQPKVIAQGTFRDKDSTPPDLVYFTDWGTLYDNVWKTQLDYGEDFIRAGEHDPDSAMAMFWMPETLMSGESRRYVTYYGLGDVSIAPGSLSIGVTSPSEVVAQIVDPKPFQIIAYVQNTADERALQVNVDLQLPEGLKLAPNQNAQYFIGNMLPDEERQISWSVIPTGSKIGNVTYKVEVKSTNTDDNLVTRDIRILSPPRLSISVDAPPIFSVSKRFNSWSIDNLQVMCEIENKGGATAYGVQASVSLPEGMELEQGERPIKPVAGPVDLKPGETRSISWQVLGDLFTGELDYKIDAFGQNVESVYSHNNIAMPKARVFVEVEGDKDDVSVGDFIVLRIVGTNIENFHSTRFDVHYDPNILRAVRVSRGEIFEQYTMWNNERPDNQRGVIKNITGVRAEEASAFGTLARISFRVEQAGKTEILLRNVEIRREDTREIMATVENGIIVAK